MTRENEAALMVTHEIKGIKCDAAGCDYIDTEARLDDYSQYLNKPCPKCGANLLTQADLDTTLALVATCRAINSIFAGSITPEMREAARARIAVHMDGSGIPSFEIKPEESP